MLLFCFLANVVCFVDRTNIAVAAIAIQEAYNWTDSDMGVALSSFFYGYATMQIPAGWLATRFGGKRVLAVCVAVWSMFTVVTPLAVYVDFNTLLLSRVGLGLAEAASMPCVHSIIGAWFPATEISFAISFSTSGQAVGTVVALMSSPMVSWYWPSVFYVSGVVGLVWTVLFLIVCPDAPTISGKNSRGYAPVKTGATGSDGGGGGGDGVGWGGSGPLVPESPGTAVPLVRVGASTDDPRDDTDDSDDDRSPLCEFASSSSLSSSLASVVSLRPVRVTGGERAMDVVTSSSIDRKHRTHGGGSSDSPGRSILMVEKSRSSQCRATARGCVSTTRALCQPSFIAICAAHTTHNYGYYVTLMWLPKYFTSLGTFVHGVFDRWTGCSLRVRLK